MSQLAALSTSSGSQERNPITLQTSTHCTLQGFHDYTEAEQFAFDRIRSVVERAFAVHGFVPFCPRPVEPVSYLCRNAGGQEITKQVFGVARLADNTLTNLGLPYDRTVPLASWITRHFSEITFPFKRWNIDISWRGEHAQPGRYRAFFQADVDIVNPNITPVADAEVISTMYDVLHKLDVGPFTMLINHISIAHALVGLLELPSEEKKAAAMRIIDKMEKLPIEEITEQILEITGPEKTEQVRELLQVFKFNGNLKDFLLDAKYSTPQCLEGLDQLKQIFATLELLGVDSARVRFCPGLVRGLEYYSGVVVETFLDGVDPETGKSYREYGSVASGGRFDNLIGDLVEGGSSRLSELKGTGMSLGLTRLFDIFVRHNLIPLDRTSTADVMVGYRTQGQIETAMRIAQMLRERGANVDLFSEEGEKVKTQLKYANAKGIPYSIIVMDQEKSFVVKEMKRSVSDRSYRGTDYTTEDAAVTELINAIGRARI